MGIRNITIAFTKGREKELPHFAKVYVKGYAFIIRAMICPFTQISVIKTKASPFFL